MNLEFGLRAGLGIWGLGVGIGNFGTVIKGSWAAPPKVVPLKRFPNMALM